MGLNVISGDILDVELAQFCQPLVRVPVQMFPTAPASVTCVGQLEGDSSRWEMWGQSVNCCRVVL